MAEVVNGTTYDWVTRDSSGNIIAYGPVTSSTGGITAYSGTPPAETTPDLVAPDNSALRQQFVDLISATTTAYNELMTANRDNDAFALRTAMEQFARTGSELGVNSWARTQATNDLRASMSAAAAVVNSQATIDALNEQASLLSQIAALDATTFSQALSVTQADQAQQSIDAGIAATTWDQTFAQTQYDDAQAAAAAAAEDAATTPAATTPTTTTSPITTATTTTPSWTTTTPAATTYQPPSNWTYSGTAGSYNWGL